MPNAKERTPPMNSDTSASPRWTRAALKARARELLAKNYWPLVLVAFVAMWSGDWGGGFLRVNFNYRRSPKIQEWLGRNTGLPYAGIEIPDEVAGSPEWEEASDAFVRAPNYSGFGNTSRSLSSKKFWDGSWRQSREWSLPGEKHPLGRERHALQASWSNEVWTISRVERDEHGRETVVASFSHPAPTARMQDEWVYDWPASIVGLVILLFVGYVVLWLYVLNPLAVGVRKYFVESHRGTARLGHLLFAFRCGHYRNVVLVALHRDLTVFLWSLLLLVPGIVKAYELRMVVYALADDPSIRWYDAFGLSKGAMNGQKADAFVLDLSFLGWWILSVLTLHLLGLFFVVPYFGLTLAGLYETLLRGLQLPDPATPNPAASESHAESAETAEPAQP